jgi:hypothetical protein
MTILFTVLGLSFGAFVLWLTVRIVNRRERWAKRVAMALVVAAVAYPLSLGPAAWLFERGLLSASVMTSVFNPLFWTYEREPGVIRAATDWYIGVWSKKSNEGIFFDPVESSSTILE